MSRAALTLLIVLVLLAVPSLSSGQQSDVTPPASRCTDLEGHPEPCPEPLRATTPEPQPADTSVRAVPADLFRIQKQFWTSPARVRMHDLKWIFPFTLVGGAVFGGDQFIEKKLPIRTSTISRSNTLSNAGIAAFAGSTAGMYFWGHLADNAQMRETGILSGEALANNFLVTTAVKYAAGRERPNEGTGSGRFFAGGVSFPSEHAAAAWSMASVIAHEYRGPLTQILAYGLASVVSATRVTGRDHFASDALIGSALGWYMGRQAYRAHHPEADDAAYGTFSAGEDRVRAPENMGSAYVPMDSWVYPAFDRLAAKGYAPSAFMGLRPWTRMECARLLNELETESDTGIEGDGAALVQALKDEFDFELSARDSGDNRRARIESLYSRATTISGMPVTDSYHFGQTIVDDFGRPYSSGSNLIAGASADATAGPLVFYIRGEYQQAPSIPALPLQAREAIAQADMNPVAPAVVTPAVQRFEPLEAYAGLTFRNTQITFGRQSLWWGPDATGALMFSDNSRPITMLRVNQVSPFRLPWLLGRLGPWRHEVFFGQLAGHLTPAHPYMFGQKLSFKPTTNLELGFSRVNILGGEGLPLTPDRFLRSFFSFSSTSNTASGDPGDRRGGFDFSYHVPRLRRWLVLNVDSLVDDDPSPLAAPRRSAIAPGVYLPQFPGIPKLDLRLEAAYTDVSTQRSLSGEFIYWNIVYRDSHSEDGNLMGHWVGREGKSYSAEANYWVGPRSNIGVGYRNSQVAGDFIPRGSTVHDAYVRTACKLSKDFSLVGKLQYEHLNLPILSISQQSNVTASLQLTYWPKWRLQTRSHPPAAIQNTPSYTDVTHPGASR